VIKLESSSLIRKADCIVLKCVLEDLGIIPKHIHVTNVCLTVENVLMVLLVYDYLMDLPMNHLLKEHLLLIFQQSICKVNLLIIKHKQ